MNIQEFKYQIKDARLEARKQRDLEVFDVWSDGTKLFSVSYVELYHLMDIRLLLAKHVKPVELHPEPYKPQGMEYK